MLFVFIAIILLSCVGYIAIQTPYVKNKIAHIGLEELNKEFGTDISVEKVEIDWKNDIIMHSVVAKDHHQYPFINIPKLQGDISIIDLIKYLYSQDWNFKNLDFDNVTLVEPRVEIITYQGETHNNLSNFISKFSNDKPASGDPFIFKSNFDLQKGLVKMYNENSDKDTLWAKEVNIVLKKFKTEGSVINGQLEKLSSLIEQDDQKVNIKKLSTAFLFSQDSLDLPNIQLLTDNSTLDANLTLKYQTTEDFKNFANLVQWEGSIQEGSHVSGNLLEFFLPTWDSDSDYFVQSDIRGTLNNLELEGLMAHSEKVKIQSPLLHLKQISSSDDFQIESKQVHAIADENSLVRLLPTSIGGKLKNTINELGTLDYNGAVLVNRQEINADGVLISQLGVLDIDAILQDYSGHNPTYRGNLIAKNATLTPLVKSPKIRNFNGDLDFSGSGFTLENADINLKGTIQQIGIENFNLQQLGLDVHFANQIVKGEFRSKDPHNDLMAKGLVNLQSSKIKADLEGEVYNLVLNQYSELTSNTQVQGKFNIQAEASNLDDLVGQLHFENVIYQSPEKVMAFSSIDIETYFDKKDRILKIFSPQNIRGKLSGRFNLEDIPVMFQNGISNLIVGMNPIRNLKDKYLFMDVDLEDNLMDLFFPKLSLQEGSNILGTYDGSTNDLILNLTAQRMSYEKLLADSVNLIINTDNPSKQIDLKLGNLSYDTYALQDLYTKGYLKNDTLRVENSFRVNGKNGQMVQLNVFQTTSDEELFIGIENSHFEVNGIQWLIDYNKEKNTNIVRYNKKEKSFYLNDLQVVSDLAMIEAKGYYKNDQDFELHAQAENVLLENIIPKNALGQFVFKGLINGEVDISQKGHIFQPLAQVNVDDLYFNTYELGALQANVSLENPELQDYSVHLDLNKNNHQYLDLNGNISNAKDKPAELQTQATFDHFEMNILNEILSGVFKDIRGTTSGEVQIFGQIQNPEYNGYLLTEDVGLTVDFLNTDYLFDNGSEIELMGSFSQGNMNFNNIGFIDTKELTGGYLFGGIQNREFSVWGINLIFESADENGLLILDTDIEDNDLFYGKVFGKGDFYLDGSTDDKITVYSDATVLKNSDFTLNNATSYNVENTSIVNYVSQFPQATDTDDLPSSKVTNKSGIELNFEIDVEDGARINVLLDQLTNSVINVEGKSNDLVFQLSETGEIEMSGIYQVSKGKYNLKLGPYTKHFDIDNNSEIIFSGDPYNASLDIHAYNEIIVNNIGQYLNSQTTPNTEVDLGVDLTGSLKEMKIDFSIEAPKASSDIQNQLQNKFFNNPDELNTQFLNLLASKRFNVEQSNLFSQSLISNGYDIVISQLLGVINDINPNFQFGATYLPEDQATNSSAFLQATFNLRLNNRWKITTVQGIPINASNATNNAIWTSEVQIEYDVSKKNDQSFVLEAFTRPTTFGIQNFASNSSTYQTYGGGVIKRWEFDKFREIFKENEKEKKEEEKEDPSPTLSPNTQAIQDSTEIYEQEVEDFMKDLNLID